VLDGETPGEEEVKASPITPKLVKNQSEGESVLKKEPSLTIMPKPV
jgi:hypothetical protein